MFLRAESVTKVYETNPVLRDVSFTVAKGEIVSFVGPSGVGKTTLLKIIAGLEKADSGRIVFGTKPTRKSPVVLVFQDYLLFPNLTVFENIAFGLKARRLPLQEIKNRVEEFLEYFGLVSKKTEYPVNLSAGQRQRVAIARAMIISPAILLLDEPFANLDQNLKQSTAEFIRRTQKAFGVTTITVTHDQEEAFLMSDSIGVMLDGTLGQYGAVREVYTHPASVDIARFFGPVTILPVEVGLSLGGEPCSEGYFIRPEWMRLKRSTKGKGRILHTAFLGHRMKCLIEYEKCELVAYSDDMSLETGERVSVTIEK